MPFPSHLAIVLLAVGIAEASVQCLDTRYSWSYNRQNQSPCDVASALLMECNPQGGPLAPLPNDAQGRQYYDPYNADHTPCLCNTITYSLVSTCGLCQDQTYLFWHQWADVCTSAGTGVWLYRYPETIPPGLDVPGWAYMDVTTTDFIQIDKAISNATASEGLTGTQTQAFSVPSNALPTTAARNSTGGTSISNSNVTYNMAPAPSDNDKGSKLDVGALIGAITGAITGLVIVTLSVLRYLAFRKKAKEKKMSQDEESHGLVSLTPAYVQLNDPKRSKKEDPEDDWDPEFDIDAKGEADYHLHG